MDLNLSPDITESFRMFQGRVRDEYERLATEFAFEALDATRDVHTTQKKVRELIGKRIEMARYRSRDR